MVNAPISYSCPVYRSDSFPLSQDTWNTYCLQFGDKVIQIFSPKQKQEQLLYPNEVALQEALGKLSPYLLKYVDKIVIHADLTHIPTIRTIMSVKRSQLGVINYFPHFAPDAEDKALEDSEVIANYLRHEVGHLCSYDQFDREGWSRWFEAAKKDKGFISGYATKDVEEDFSESFAGYFTLTQGNAIVHSEQKILSVIQSSDDNPFHNFECIFPNRAQILHELRKKLDSNATTFEFSGLCQINTEAVSSILDQYRRGELGWIEGHNLFKSIYQVYPACIEAKEALKTVIVSQMKVLRDWSARMFFAQELLIIDPEDSASAQRFSALLIGLRYSPLRYIGVRLTERELLFTDLLAEN